MENKLINDIRKSNLSEESKARIIEYINAIETMKNNNDIPYTYKESSDLINGKGGLYQCDAEIFAIVGERIFEE